MDLLREHGSLADDEWAKLLVAAGRGYLGEMEELVEHIDHPLLGLLPDGRNFALDILLEGRVLTHRLSALEIASGIVDASPDLMPLTVLASIRSEDGDAAFAIAFRGMDDDVFDERGVEDPDWPYDEGLVLGPDALDGFVEGDVVGLAVVEGELQLRPVTADELLTLDLTASLGEIVDDTPGTIAIAFWQLMVDDPMLFTVPTVPIGELVSSAGCFCEGDYIAVEGFDFEEDRAMSRVDLLMHAHELGPEEAVAVVAFGKLISAIEQGTDDEANNAAQAMCSSLSEMLGALANPVAASAAFGETAARLTEGSDALHIAASVLRENGPRRIAPAAHWLAGKAAERDGKTLEAERHYERALTLDPKWEPALADVARYASDRGDASRALSLLGRTADGHTEPMYELLSQYIPSERRDLGRNDRCWCGSGRKYKVCHLGKAEYTLDDRARWLYQKAGQFADAIEWRPIIMSLAEVRAAHDEDPYGVLRALEDGLVIDVAMFECGIFEAFVERRGDLLPTDELLLAQQWLLAERSVHEVVAVRPGSGLSLRDVRTGDQLEVVERTASQQLRVGDFFCGRVVSAGSTTQIFGGLEPIVPSQRQQLIDLLDDEMTDPLELVEFLSARFAPTRVVTRDGHPMVLCEARFEVDAVGIRRKLGRRYGAGQDDSWTWSEDSRIHGTLRLEGGELVVEAMSEPRFADLIDAVESMDPKAKLLQEKRTPAEKALSEQRQTPAPATQMDADDPVIAAALDEYIRKYEGEWVDDSIPALEGFTPRQAAADPTRRDDLIRLLESFPQQERPGAMSVRRLREVLGLNSFDGGPAPTR